MIVLLRRQEALRLRNGSAAKRALSSGFLREGQGKPCGVAARRGLG
jgi:hypothetical protein